MGPLPTHPPSSLPTIHPTPRCLHASQAENRAAIDGYVTDNRKLSEMLEAAEANLKETRMHNVRLMGEVEALQRANEEHAVLSDRAGECAM